jgi:hypothetical protein
MKHSAGKLHSFKRNSFIFNKLKNYDINLLCVCLYVCLSVYSPQYLRLMRSPSSDYVSVFVFVYPL